MAQRERLYLDKSQRETLRAMVEEGEVDNPSEAARRLIDAGAAELRGDRDTGPGPMASVAAEFSRAFAWVGIGWLAVTLLFPVEIRLGAVFAFAAAVGCSGLYVVLERHEPRVRRALSGVFGGGESA